MNYKDIIIEMKNKFKIQESSINQEYDDEVYIKADEKDFKNIALFLHDKFNTPVMSYFALDSRSLKNVFEIYCAFLSTECKKWFFVHIDVSKGYLKFPSISKDIYSGSLFEREIMEMFGLEPEGNPDLRRLRLHDEVWPGGFYPLRKDFSPPEQAVDSKQEYKFMKVEGEGVFEVPVGPVHAGIIGPGHFRFSVAGEPIINLEIRLGFTHRGAEKLFECKNIMDAVSLSECVSGDSAFANSTAFCRAAEKIFNVKITDRVLYLRAIFLEMERMYNHVNGIGGIAVDVGFSMPNALASLIKEKILRLNEKLTGSRYLKNINEIGNIKVEFNGEYIKIILSDIQDIEKDFNELVLMLKANVSFMDRVDGTGILKKKTAEDFGVLGLAGRSSGIAVDLREIFPANSDLCDFKIVKREKGDVLSRLELRIDEFKESVRLVRQLTGKNITGKNVPGKLKIREGFALGFSEGWRGPVLYWIKVNSKGDIERCKIVDPSFRSWMGLSFAVLGNIIPDFPLCNKSFDLSYSGNDL